MPHVDAFVNPSVRGGDAARVSSSEWRRRPETRRVSSRRIDWHFLMSQRRVDSGCGGSALFQQLDHGVSDKMPKLDQIAEGGY